MMRFAFACTVGAVLMEPIAVGPLVQQPLWQAASPTGIKISYDVPVYSSEDEIQRRQKSGFLQQRPESEKSIQKGELAVEDTSSIRSEILTAKEKIAGGGGSDNERKGLSALINLVNAPAARSLMVASGVISAAKNLMVKEKTNAEVRGLAGSLLTQITNLPVAIETTTQDDGSYGNVHIVMPRPSRVYQADKAIFSMGQK